MPSYDMGLDPRAKAPDYLKELFKKLQRLKPEEVDADSGVLDFQRGLSPSQRSLFISTEKYSSKDLQRAFAKYSKTDLQPNEDYSRVCYEAKNIPGLVIIPALLPFHVQSEVLNNTLLRDLSNPSHNTNIHFHHSIKYPECGKSFFGLEPFSSSHFEPLDPLAHKPLSVERVLNKRLRWMTLGGQYDWTAKQYPSEKPPAFPEDLQELLHRFFPHTVAEAAIVNVYSPGDILSLHRDVSEFCNRGLISISIGCDALFVIALGKEGHNQNSAEYAVIRLRSGDAVYMTGESRYAWHGVPQIIPNTCPEELQAWPCISNSDNSMTMKPDSENTRFRYWHSWLARKRINLNVRQMFEG